jgi:dihydropteroate synthase
MRLTCGKYCFSSDEPVVMGVLNVTPDSFSDGGQFNRLDAALYHAEEMLLQGAGIIDVGGESTKPGAEPVSVDEELSRVVPVVEAICCRLDVPVSVDTSKAEVMQSALSVGASMINDVQALSSSEALKVVANSNAAVCLMHMQKNPAVMQENPTYANIIEEVLSFLKKRISMCVDAGIDRHRILVDPGFGFGKTLEHNVTLFSQLSLFNQLQVPLLVGVSKKRMIGDITGAEIDNRVVGSVVASVLAVQNGANFVRVHDVKETLDGLRILHALGAK